MADTPDIAFSADHAGQRAVHPLTLSAHEKRAAFGQSRVTPRAHATVGRTAVTDGGRGQRAPRGRGSAGTSDESCARAAELRGAAVCRTAVCRTVLSRTALSRTSASGGAVRGTA